MAFEYQGFATLGVNLNRQKYGPLDISGVFLTQADLNYYLSKGAITEGVSTYWYESADKKVVPYPYAGQVIATVFDGVAKVYVLSEKADGTFETKNVGDTTAVEADVSALQSAIDEINTTIGTEAAEGAEATGFYKLFDELRASITANAEAIGTKATEDAEATGIYKLIEDSAYDDNDVKASIKAIADDYLKSTDKVAIDESIAQVAEDATKAANDAKDAAIKAVLTGEATGEISEAYDTIKEIADWIESGDSEGLDLIQRVAAIESDYLTEADKYNDSDITSRLDAAEAELETLTVKSADETEFTLTDGVLSVNKIAQAKVDGLTDALTDHESRIGTVETDVADIVKDYLTSADKTTLQTGIDNLTTAVGTLPEGITSVVDYADSLIDGLNIGQYAKTTAVDEVSNKLTEFETSTNNAFESLGERVDTVESEIEACTIKSADANEFTVTDGVIAIKAIAQDKVTGLADALAGKVSVKTSEYDGATVAHRLLTPEEQDKLSKLVLNEDGSVTTGQVVAAGDVQGLADWITNNAATVDGLFSDEDATVLASAIQGIKINGTAITVSDDKTVEIPVATNSVLGVIKGTEAVLDASGNVTNPNTVSVKETGELEVNAISTDKLVQGDEELVLYGGSASDFKTVTE